MLAKTNPETLDDFAEIYCPEKPWENADYQASCPWPRQRIIAADYWNVVAIQIGREKVAETWLKRIGFEVYAPTVRDYKKPRRNQISHSKRRRHCTLREEYQRPFLRGYMFIRPNASGGRLSSIFELPGVRGLVHFDDVAARIPDGLIQKMKVEISGGLMDAHFAVSANKYEVSEQVRVAEGPFAAFHAVIEAVDESKELIHLLVNLFGRQTRTVISVEQIEKL